MPVDRQSALRRDSMHEIDPEGHRDSVATGGKRFINRREAIDRLLCSISPALVPPKDSEIRLHRTHRRCVLLFQKLSYRLSGMTACDVEI
jgi:hypothetical protein